MLLAQPLDAATQPNRSTQKHEPAPSVQHSHAADTVVPMARSSPFDQSSEPQSGRSNGNEVSVGHGIARRLNEATAIRGSVGFRSWQWIAPTRAVAGTVAGLRCVTLANGRCPG